MARSDSFFVAPSQGLDGAHQFQGRPHGPLGVADELLHHAAIAGDQRARYLEVPREDLTHLFWVPGLRQRGEPHQVGEEDRAHPALGHRGDRSARGRRPGPRSAVLGGWSGRRCGLGQEGAALRRTGPRNGKARHSWGTRRRATSRSWRKIERRPGCRPRMTDSGASTGNVTDGATTSPGP